MQQQSPQAFGDMIGEFDAGVFEQKATAALREVAQGVTATRKAGKVTLTFDFKPIGDSNQVTVAHTVTFSRPTHKGKVTEEDTTNTPMHVGRAGHLSLFPEAQQKLPLGTPAKSEA